METTIKIQEIEAKTGKTGTAFWAIKDDMHNSYTCFEKDVVENLVIGKPANVEVAVTEKNGKTYKNIRTLYNIDGNTTLEKVNPVEVAVTPQTVNELSPDKPSDPYKYKNAMMLTSYAKDVFNAIEDKEGNMADLMEAAAEIVLVAYDKILSEL